MLSRYVFKKSTRKGKKYDVYKDGKYLVSFGSSSNAQYEDTTPLKLYKHLDHKDKERRRLFYLRFKKNPKFESALWFSSKYLWDGEKN